MKDIQETLQGIAHQLNIDTFKEGNIASIFGQNKKLFIQKLETWLNLFLESLVILSLALDKDISLIKFKESFDNYCELSKLYSITFGSESIKKFKLLSSDLVSKFYLKGKVDNLSIMINTLNDSNNIQRNRIIAENSNTSKIMLISDESLEFYISCLSEFNHPKKLEIEKESIDKSKEIKKTKLRKVKVERIEIIKKHLKQVVHGSLVNTLFQDNGFDIYSLFCELLLFKIKMNKDFDNVNNCLKDLEEAKKKVADPSSIFLIDYYIKFVILIKKIYPKDSKIDAKKTIPFLSRLISKLRSEELVTSLFCIYFLEWFLKNDKLKLTTEMKTWVESLEISLIGTPILFYIWELQEDCFIPENNSLDYTCADLIRESFAKNENVGLLYQTYEELRIRFVCTSTEKISHVVCVCSYFSFINSFLLYNLNLEFLKENNFESDASCASLDLKFRYGYIFIINFQLFLKVISHYLSLNIEFISIFEWIVTFSGTMYPLLIMIRRLFIFCVLMKVLDIPIENIGKHLEKFIKNPFETWMIYLDVLSNGKPFYLWLFEILIILIKTQDFKFNLDIINYDIEDQSKESSVKLSTKYAKPNFQRWEINHPLDLNIQKHKKEFYDHKSLKNNMISDFYMDPELKNFPNCTKKKPYLDFLTPLQNKLMEEMSDYNSIDDENIDYEKKMISRNNIWNKAGKKSEIKSIKNYNINFKPITGTNLGMFSDVAFSEVNKNKIIKNNQFFTFLQSFETYLTKYLEKRNKVLKYLNVFKQKDYYSEMFFMKFDQIFSDFCLGKYPSQVIKDSINFLEEIDNFYPNEIRKTGYLRRGIFHVLFESLILLKYNLSAMISNSEFIN